MNNVGKWITLFLLDGMLFEGAVVEETVYGVYIHVGGSSDRLSLFPWHVISRVVYKS